MNNSASISNFYYNSFTDILSSIKMSRNSFLVFITSGFEIFCIYFLLKWVNTSGFDCMLFNKFKVLFIAPLWGIVWIYYWFILSLASFKVEIGWRFLKFNILLGLLLGLVEKRLRIIGWNVGLIKLCLEDRKGLANFINILWSIFLY